MKQLSIMQPEIAFTLYLFRKPQIWLHFIFLKDKKKEKFGFME